MSLYTRISGIQMTFITLSHVKSKMPEQSLVPDLQSFIFLCLKNLSITIKTFHLSNSVSAVLWWWWLWFSYR